MPTVNVRTIAKHLDGMLYTLKLSRQLPAERNRPEVIQHRKAYAPVVPRRGQSKFLAWSGGMLPRKILKSRVSEMPFPTF